MGITDLKFRLRDLPGAVDLTMKLANGRQMFALGDYHVFTDALATDAEIETAIRNALRLPPVALIPDRPKEPAMSVTGSGHAGLSLSARLKAIRAKVELGAGKMDAALTRMEQATDAHSKLADAVGSEADALMAEMAQFTNGAPESV